MPLSPYHTVIYPPIHDLEECRRDLRQSRSEYESGECDNYAEGLLECGENLLEHYDFLDQKLKIKVRVHLVDKHIRFPLKNIVQWQDC